MSYLNYFTCFFLLAACTQKRSDIPFTENFTSYIRPVKTKISWGKYFKAQWQEVSGDSLARELPSPETKIDFSKLPVSLHDTLDFKTLPHANDSVYLNFDALPSHPLDIDTLKATKAKWEIFTLPAPKRVKSLPFHRNYDVPEPVFNYGREQGLPGNNSQCLLNDSYGRMWLGTDEGLCVFDGEYWSIYELKHSERDLLEDTQHRIWIASDSGIDVLNLQDGLRMHLSGNARGDFTKLVEDRQQRIWITDARGASIRVISRELDLIRSIKCFSQADDAPVMAADEEGRIWIKGKTSLYACDTRKHLYKEMTLPLFATNNTYPNAVACTKKGKVWFSGGLTTTCCYDPHKSLLECIGGFPATGNLRRALTLAINETNGLVYAGVIGGMDIYDPRSKRMKHLDKKYFSSFGIDRIVIDRHGQVWSSGTFADVYCPQNVQQQFYTNATKSLFLKYVLEDAKGKSWFVDASSIYFRDDADELRQFSLQNKFIISLFRDRSHRVYVQYYTTTAPAIQWESFIYDPLTQTYRVKQFYGAVWDDYCQDSTGKIWTSSSWTYHGIDVWDAGFKTMKRLLGDSLTVGVPYPVLTQRNGNVWIKRIKNKGDFSYEYLYVYDPAKDSLRQLLLPAEIRNRDISCVLEDSRGLMWMGTSEGIYIFDEKENTLQHLSLAEGLPDKNISAVKEIAGQVYVVSNEGASVISVPAKGLFSIKNYGLQQGSIRSGAGWSNPDRRNNALVTHDHKFSWCTDNCISTIDPSQQDTLVPVTCIVGLDVMQHAAVFTQKSKVKNGDGDTISFLQKGISWDSTSGPYALPVGLQLPYAQNHLTFYFTGMHLDNPGKITYRYLLVGLDEKWNALSDKPLADYRNIPPGTYTFKVCSRGFNGLWSSPAAFSFRITPPWWQTPVFRAGFVLFLFLCIVLIFHRRTAALRRRQKELEQTVEERTAELSSQKKLLEEKNKEVRDSIQYAKRFQDAMLPLLKLVKEIFPESFVLYLPKDIVAGDFYWLERKGNQVLFAVADCTGHGVPGAMVSVVCSNALNRVVNEFYLSDPGAILDSVRELVVQTYAKSETDVKDGMDISFACLDLETKELKWAGAHNPAWIIRADVLSELPADRQPVGKSDQPKPFTTQTFQMQSGDVLYLFSDGFADQFGGPKNKKFKTAAFKTLLLSLAQRSMEEQQAAIIRAFSDWKSEAEQVDDICIFGVKIL